MATNSEESYVDEQPLSRRIKKAPVVQEVTTIRIVEGTTEQSTSIPALEVQALPAPPAAEIAYETMEAFSRQRPNITPPIEQIIIYDECAITAGIEEG